MKTVILCGGLGARLSEETQVKPKPMVSIGDKPILWHIMNIYSHFGFNEFILATGYKGESIKDYFLNYYNFNSDLVISLKNGNVKASKNCYRDWLVNIVDTGLNTMTGGRLLRLKDKLGDGPFMLTYGDGVGNIDIKKLLKFHRSHGKIASVTAVRPNARFGGITFNNDLVIEFREKPQSGEGWINGGFFVFEPEIFGYIDDDSTVLERKPLEKLAKDKQLVAYKHEGFWQPMDTMRDKQLLEETWKSGNAPWKIWK